MKSSITRSATLLTFLSILAAGASVVTAADLEIRVREESTVKGGTVTLQEIAIFTPDTDPRVEGLSRLEVASAPSPGSGVSLSRNFLYYKIGTSVLGKGEDIRLEIPAAVSIRRTANIIPARQLEQIYKDHILAHAAWNPEKILFERVDAPEGVALPEGRVHWEVWEKGGDRYQGNVVLTIHFFVDGKQTRTVQVSGKVIVRQEVLKAARKINPGQILSIEHVNLETEQNVHLQRDVLTLPEDAVGKRAIRAIQSGQPITSQMLEDPPAIKKGTRVIIVARNETILVSASGKAMVDGRVGEEIRVVNLSSGREIHAMVKGPGMVEVPF